MTMRSALLRAAAMLLGLAALWARPVGAVGFQYVSVPGPDDRPLDVGIWYPSDTPASAQPRALLPQTVAPDGRLAGRRLPLIVISHGSGGWFGGHVDTALALAEAGYVVAAPTHAGDNYKDTVQFGTVSVLTSRPRQVVRVVDFMLESWAGHDQLDPPRTGIFAFAAAARIPARGECWPLYLPRSLLFRGGLLQGRARHRPHRLSPPAQRLVGCFLQCSASQPLTDGHPEDPTRERNPTVRARILDRRGGAPRPRRERGAPRLLPDPPPL